MSKNIKQEDQEGDRIAKAVIKKRRRISVVWFIPLIAAAIGAWLLYKSIVEAGLPITLHFKDGSGIIKGKTLILYEGVGIGVVDSVKLKKDLTGVVVQATLDKEAAGMAREETLFWLVKPRLDISGVSGLETLVSGEYIDVRPGGGAPKTVFTALDEPPLQDASAPGLHLVLSAKILGSLVAGTPIYTLGIQVGSVQGHQFSEDEKQVLIQIYIKKQYVSMVHKNTRFWNASGLTVKAGLSGVSVRSQPLATLLIGGVAFETPEGKEGELAKNGTVFQLYEDYESATESGVPIQISFESGQGLDSQTPIKYKGLTVGKVKKVTIGQSLDKVIVHALLDELAASAAVQGSLFWVVEAEIGFGGITGLSTLVSGKYIEVVPGNGPPQRVFEGLEQAPLGDDDSQLKIVLHADRLGSLKVGVPIYYRQIKVGQVNGYELAKTADKIVIHASIEDTYALLVRENTRFWNASGIGMDIGLFGASVHIESLQTLLEGGIAFATPENRSMGVAVKDGHVFNLYDEPKDAWLEWKPVIPLNLEHSGNHSDYLRQHLEEHRKQNADSLSSRSEPASDSDATESELETLPDSELSQPERRVAQHHRSSTR